MAVPFLLLTIEELTDGRVHVEWETVADDGLLLVEGDIFTPDPEVGLEEAVGQWLEARRAKRQQINNSPKVGTKPRPKIKRETAVLDQSAVGRLKSRVAQ